jgi:hypothetical protein
MIRFGLPIAQDLLGDFALFDLILMFEGA